MLRTGLDRAAEAGMPAGRAGLLTHCAAVDSNLRESPEVVREIPGMELAAVFGPQHGYYGQTQDNMVEWRGGSLERLGVPLYSLYGEVRRPGPDMLDGLDLLLVDLQDVGSRYYTYIYTMALSMRAAAEQGIPVIVLDRPNPLGGRVVEGATLDPDYSSFVGMYPIPVRHALTIGEAAQYFAYLDGLPAPMVVEMEGWSAEGFQEERRWVLPSPNMPTSGTAHVYPGMCLLEGTNVSEGRGTTRPFEIFGAPWVDGWELAARLNGSPWLEGALLRPHEFIPTFGKHAGEPCRGAQIHVLDRERFRPFRAGLAILAELWTFVGTSWKQPPYEYETGKLPIDILAGGTEVRIAAETHDDDALARLSRADLDAYRSSVSPFLIYERELIP
ncbi:DUF1343 domain-containing protein [Candidatus Fermentibacterales bacterium]|nr:DUF1343 domain-containing protein [Candidatus Fermentibacterales bacterium]